ncbi:hypothetical protein ACFFRR_010731 [Megaselia abdita]
MEDFHTPKLSLTPTMAAVVTSGSDAASIVTPINHIYKFPSTPSQMMGSGNHLKVKGSRRSFTPMRNIIKSPELSPIEFNLKNPTVFRIPPEKIDRVPADSTMNLSLNFPISSPPDYSLKTPVTNKSYLNHNISLDPILMSHHLHKYIQLFEKEEIDFEVFISLSENDLIRLGVESSHDRHKMLKAIKEFQ